MTGFFSYCVPRIRLEGLNLVVFFSKAFVAMGYQLIAGHNTLQRDNKWRKAGSKLPLVSRALFYVEINILYLKDHEYEWFIDLIGKKQSTFV